MDSAGDMPRTIRVVALMEGQFVTGPAKNLLEFAQRARQPSAGLPMVDLSLITYHRDASSDPSTNPLIAAANAAGVAVDVIHERSVFDYGIVSQISGAVERRKPDLIQTHNVKSHFLARYTGLPQKYPWIVFHHGYTATDLKQEIYNQLDRWSLRGARHVVTVCGAFKQQLVSRGIAPGKISIRHNAIRISPPIDKDRARAILDALPCAAGTPVLLMVSRLSHEKGHLDLLEALAILKTRGVAVHALIVGEGTERAAIEKSRDRLGLQEFVTLAGHDNDVKPYFAAADLYLMPSHSEGSPNALLEAMAGGIPAIASNVGGIPEMIVDGISGILLPPRNPEALANAIARLVENADEARRLAANAVQATAKFTYEAHYQATIEVYQRVLGIGSAGKLASVDV